MGGGEGGKRRVWGWGKEGEKSGGREGGRGGEGRGGRGGGGVSEGGGDSSGCMPSLVVQWSKKQAGITLLEVSHSCRFISY